MVLNDKTEAKMLILAIADSFESDADFDSTASIIMNCTGITNMQYLELVAELSESKLVETYSDGDKAYFSLTDSGISVAANAKENLRFIDLSTMISKARLEYERIVEGKEYLASIEPSSEDGMCVVTYEYRLYGKTRFSLAVTYDDFSRAENSLSRINSDPAYFRNYILNYLRGNPAI